MNIDKIKNAATPYRPSLKTLEGLKKPWITKGIRIKMNMGHIKPTMNTSIISAIPNSPGLSKIRPISKRNIKENDMSQYCFALR